MERQAEAGQSHLEGQEHFLPIGLALESHDEVVRVAHGQCDRVQVTTPLVGPEIEDVVIGPSITQGALMRSWRSAARKVKVR